MNDDFGGHKMRKVLLLLFTFLSSLVFGVAKADISDKEYCKAFVEEKGSSLIKIMMDNTPTEKKFKILLDFVNKNMDTTKMSKGALAGVYRMVPSGSLSNDRKKILEGKVIKYLCSTYVRLANDKLSSCKNGYELSVYQVESKKNSFVVYSVVKLCDGSWKINTYFLKNSKKPINITFDNFSVLDKQAFVTLYREAKLSIDEFEKKLDALIIK